MKVKHRHDLPVLLNYLNLLGRGATIGVQRGHFCQHILQKWWGQKLYMIDIWRHLKDDEYLDIANVSPQEQLNCMVEAFQRIYDFDDRAVLIREFSEQAAFLIPDGSLDFVYIDADHSYAGCKKDLEVWWPKVKVGGVFSGDDYADSPFEENGWAEFGVKRAVDEFCAKHKLEIQVTEDQILADAAKTPAGSWIAIKGAE